MCGVTKTFLPFHAAILALALLLLPCTGDAVRVRPIDRVRLRAALSCDRATLQGTVAYPIHNETNAPLEAVALWLYPNRFAEPNPGLDDRMIKWIYPAGATQGKITITAMGWNGEPLGMDRLSTLPMPEGGTPANVKEAIARVTLPRPLRPGERGHLALEFTVTIPKRRGRFGRWRGTVSLGGEWFPRLMRDRSGRVPLAAVNSLIADVELTVPDGHGVVLNRQVFAPRHPSPPIRLTTAVEDGLSLVIIRQMQVYERQFDWGKAIFVSQLDTKPDTGRPPPDEDGSGLFQIVSTPHRVMWVVDNTAKLLQSAAPTLSIDEPFVVVSVPAWDRMVQAGPGMILLSNRIWQIIPVKAGLWFHDLALVGAVGAELARWWGDSHRPLALRAIDAEMIGGYLAQRYSAEVHKQRRSVEEIVSFASFLPAVDNFLYAPQSPFKEVYFKPIEEPDPLRDEPWRFRNRFPRGRRVLAKLIDLKGEEETRRLIGDALRENRELTRAIVDELGPDGPSFFEQWFGDYPRVNYRLGQVEEISLENGRIRHRAEIIRQGEPITEPVTVRFTDEQSQVADVVWHADGSRGEVEWISDAPLDQVQIDPDRRLVESPELTAGHPLADNQNELPWRPPLLSRVLIWGDPVAREPYVVATLGLRRRYDITHSFWLDGHYRPTGYGGFLAYRYSFGPKRTLNARSWHWGPNLSVDRHRPVDEANIAFPENTRFGATMTSLGLSLGHDNRAYFHDPLDGVSFSVSARYLVGQADDDRVVQASRFTARVFSLFSPTHRHTFAWYGGALSVIGEPVAANLVSLSDRQLLRGFELSETYGRIGAYTVLEYRHTLFSTAQVDIPFMSGKPVFASWIERVQGVLFAGAGTVTRPDGFKGLFTADRLFTEVGYGLRLHSLVFGAYQYLVGVDFAVPLTPLNRRVDVVQPDGSIASRKRAPFKLMLAMTQTF